MLSAKPEYLVGCGSDDHRITRRAIKISGKIKPLILAGTLISKEHSPIAHSDGDAVYHAICNALFLAIGERDIGYHFPDTDPNYIDIKSGKLLRYALKRVKDNGYSVNNVTAMITAGKPRISPHIDKMKRNVAKLLGIDIRCVGIGATSGEGLSAHASGEGINVIAQVSLKKIPNR